MTGLGRDRALPILLVALMLGMGAVPLFAPAPLAAPTLAEDARHSPGSVVDVPNWRVGDTWVFDAAFDVAGLIAAGGVSANVQTLTGTLTSQLDRVVTETIENRSTLVYVVESSGTFGANGVSLDGYTGDLEVDYDGVEKYRVSDLALISRSMAMDVDFTAFGFINIDVADITILTAYGPPQEGYDFPLSVGETWWSNTTTDVQWSGSSDYFEMPEDETSQSKTQFGVVGTGDPGVPYNGCAGSYNITETNETGVVTGFKWYCPPVRYDAWQHIENSIGLIIDFRLKQYNPVTRSLDIAVNLEYPAWVLDGDLGVWLNVTDSSGAPVSGETLEFRYEAESDVRSTVTAANGSAYLTFDTGHFADSSPTPYDYASHGVIAWTTGSEQIGVSTITLDDNLLEVDLVASAEGVVVERIRDGVARLLAPSEGWNAIPGDQLNMSIPVSNQGILTSAATFLEISTPDGGSTSAAIPALPARSETRVDVSWTVPAGQSIGDVAINFEVDPDQLVTNDGDRSNNADGFALFIGRLPVANLAEALSKPTFEDVLLDASGSNDPDGGEITCTFSIEDEAGDVYNVVAPDCTHVLQWADDGTYDVSIEILDDEGDLDTAERTVTISNRPGLVNMVADETSVMVGEPVTFNVDDYSDIDTTTPDAPLAFLWEPDCEEGRVTQSCTVRPTVEGVYTARITAIDDDGAPTEASHSITVTNIAPYDGSIQAESGGEVVAMDGQMVWHIEEDQVVTLTGSVSDSPNDMASLRWEWQPDALLDPTRHMVGEGPSHSIDVSWTQDGMHSIVLEVFDDDDESSGPILGWVDVANVAPTIEAFETPFPVWEDQTVLIEGIYTDTASDVDGLRACWDLDPFHNLDETGSADDDCDVVGAGLIHSWGVAGTYDIIFHVTDDDGEIASETVTYTVRNRAPEANINITDLSPVVGEVFRLAADGTTDSASDLPLLRYRWDLDTTFDSDDDGDAANDIDATGPEVYHTFNEPGEHRIRLQVSDEAQTTTKDATFTVQAADGGFFGWMSGGDSGTSIVMILGLVFVALILVLALTSLRDEKERAATDMWEATSDVGIGMPGTRMPSAAPGAAMFGGAPNASPAPAAAPAQEAAPEAPPLPATGLPEGWTMEQWQWYGHQWLEDNPPQPVQTAPPPTFDSMELDF